MDKLIFKLFCLGALSFLVIFSSGCKNATSYATKEIPYEINKEPEAYFCPEDDCGKAYIGQIKSANATVHCAFYDIDLKEMVNALSNKSKTADVKVVMDSSNYDGQIKGNAVKFDGNEQLMHNKFCVIDNEIVITGSFNPTDNDNYRNNNNVVVIYSKTLAKNYESEFDELWNGKFGQGTNVNSPIAYVNSIRIENYFCPEDGCALRIIDLIKNAKRSVHFMSFSFTHEGIADAIIRKDNIDIKGIFDSQQSAIKYSQFKRLNGFGIDVKKDLNKYKMHHKVFIIDNETVATGSFNPTLSADTKNDENLIVIHDRRIAGEFMKEFYSLWEE